MIKPIYSRFACRCPICNCKLNEDDIFCPCCWEPLDWSEDGDGEDE